jgi:hypothetical protein
MSWEILDGFKIDKFINETIKLNKVMIIKDKTSIQRRCNSTWIFENVSSTLPN